MTTSSGSLDHFRAVLSDSQSLPCAKIASRNPDAIRASKRLFANLANAQAADQFAMERREIGALIGSPNQVEAVMAGFEKRAPKFEDPEER